MAINKETHVLISNENNDKTSWDMPYRPHLYSELIDRMILDGYDVDFFQHLVDDVSHGNQDAELQAINIGTAYREYLPMSNGEANVGQSLVGCINDFLNWKKSMGDSEFEKLLLSFLVGV